jgi:hypothetical protein
MRWAASGLLALALACKPTKAPAPAASPAIEACRRALAESSNMSARDRVRHAMRGCAGTVSQPDCRDAQLKFVKDFDEPALYEMGRRCAAAYCPKLRKPKPSICGDPDPTPASINELNVAMLRLDIGPGWEGLADAMSGAHAPVQVIVDAMGPASAAAPEPPWLELAHPASGGAGLTLHSLDGGSPAWAFDEGDDVARDLAVQQLRQSLQRLDEGPHLTIRAEHQILHRTFRAVAGAASDAGYPKLHVEMIDGGR